MKLTNIILHIFFLFVTLWSTGNCGISASKATSTIIGHNIYDIFRNVEWSCTSNETCTTPQSFCNKEGNCQCPLDHVFNAAMTVCLEVAIAYGGKCTETAQCVAYLSIGGICTNNTCNCDKGYHYLHGQCNKSSGLGEKCQTDDDCYANADFEALSCVHGVCRCSEGFYQREYRTCRREAKRIGAECMIDLDCTFDENALCDKKSGCYVNSKNPTNYNEDEVKSHASLNLQDFRHLGKNLIAELRCKFDKDCSYLGQSTCTGTGYCICQRGYGLDAKKKNCIPELGETCQSDDDVAISNAICRDGRWSCKGSRVPSKNNLLCRKATTTFNTSCQHDEQCYVFGPDSVCENKRCICNENSHYDENNMFCWINRRIGEACKKNEDCHVEEFNSKLYCNEEFKCSCPIGSHVNSAQTFCINDTQVLGDSCSSDADCKSLSNAQCLKGSCSCNDNYFDLSGACVAGIGAMCYESRDCKTKNSTCHSKFCHCKEGLVSPYPDICIPVSPFGSECHYDIQCSTTTFDAVCRKPEVAKPNESAVIESIPLMGICNCREGHHRNFDKCYRTKVLGERCYSRGECYVTSNPDSIHCLKGVCTCDFDTTRINSTFCGTDASTTIVFSNVLILSLFFVVEVLK